MFKTSKDIFKIPSKKTEKPFPDTSFCFSFADFEMQSFPTDLIFLQLCLKNLLSYTIQLFHGLFQQQIFNDFFYKSL